MPKKSLPAWSRSLHRWGTVLVAVPFLIVLVSGLLLMWKKDVAWIQPASQRGAGTEPRVSFEEILDAARTAGQARIHTWADVDRLDVRPDRGIVKVRGRSGWEVQVDAETGAVLHVAYRRSDLIEALHDGSWFHDHAKLWIFFPAALVVLGLYLTGLYLFYLPYRTKRRRAASRPDGHPVRSIGAPGPKPIPRTRVTGSAGEPDVRT